MAKLTSESREKTLEKAIRRDGSPVVFSRETIESDREMHITASETSLREERARQAKSVEAASKIYLTL